MAYGRGRSLFYHVLIMIDCSLYYNYNIDSSNCMFFALFDNQKQWSMVFSNIVSNAMILGVLSSTGLEGDYNQTLQVVT